MIWLLRGIFYNARQISAQLDKDFRIPNYNDIKKVYSIWICMNSPENLENSIVEYAVKPRTVTGNVTKFGKYDLQTVILVNLPKTVTESKPKRELMLQRYLGTLFSATMKPEEKISLLEREYGPIHGEIEGGYRNV